MAELGRDGIDGLRFRAADPADLANALGRFLEEPDLAERLARNLPQFKAIDKHARDIEDLYHRLACGLR
ncbi:MAG TPA: hypothetical protein VMS76_16430 [Planctomycetota bacterium]|nr:hypothetical protein [Planctomycetota bacterium]